MNPLKFKWEPGDIVTVSSQRSTKYYIILGTTKMSNEQHLAYLAKMFGESKSRRFIGYHTKAFQTMTRGYSQVELWFEGMQSKYLWDVEKRSVERLTDVQKKAYEAALEDATFYKQNYYESQIKFIFREASRQ